MPAPLRVRTRERLIALTCVALVQLALGVALFSGLSVDVSRPRELVLGLIEVTLAPVPPPPSVAELRGSERVERQRQAAPSTTPTQPGGSPELRQAPKSAAPTSVIVAKSASNAPSGGGSGTGPALGPGNGGGAGGQGDGDAGDGGADLVQIAGAILPSDYPRALRERGIGGRVGVVFEVGPDGRVAGCSVTRSSGTPELDALTCRLILQRFRYRPSTDRNGRPIADEVDGEHDWIATRR